MWQHIKNLNLGVDKEIIGNEGFLVNGMVTAYFLPLPSMIRGLLSLIGYATSSILSVALGCLVFCISSLLIWQKIVLSNQVPATTSNKILCISGVLFCTMLSPMLGMLSYPTVFWEAIIWASALFLSSCMLSFYTLQNYQKKPGILFIFAGICGVTLFTRATISFATCLLFSLTIIQLIAQEWQVKRGFIQNIFGNKFLISSILLFAFSVGSLLTFNYIKWGKPFEFYPLQYYIMMSDAQKARYFAHGALSFDRIPQTFSYYFLPSPDNFSTSAPFIKTGSISHIGDTSSFDYISEPSLPITITQPLAILLSLIGVLSAPLLFLQRKKKMYRALIPSSITTLIPIVFILCVHSLSLRYMGDFLSAILIYALIGLSNLPNLIPNKLRSLCATSKPTWAFIPLVCIGITVGISCLLLSTAGALLQNEYWKIPFLNFNLLPMKNGEVVNFKLYGNNGKAVQYLHKGWSSELEEFGVWSNSNTATVVFQPPNNFNINGRLLIKARAFVTPAHPEQIIDILINGKHKQTVKLNNPDFNQIIIKSPFSTYELGGNPSLIGSSLFNLLTMLLGVDSQMPIYVTFNIHNPARPSDLGIGKDDRLLGIGLISATLE